VPVALDRWHWKCRVPGWARRGPIVLDLEPHNDQWGRAALVGWKTVKYMLMFWAETKEQIGGYNVIECAGLDAAIRVAAGHPLARTAKVEVRPFWDAPWDH
jgi:YCII-related domain